MSRTTGRSMLSMQLGQETIYLIMTIAVATAMALALMLTRYTTPEKDPPIIIMRETEGYNFATGSATVSQAFSKKLHDEIVPKIRDSAWRDKTAILEIIGHTDEIPLKRDRRLVTNLDYTLTATLEGRDSKPPIAADNIGLGMARAVTVARMLRTEGLGTQFQIIPMSAGPFQKIDEDASTFEKSVDDSSRRRIEIRVRRRRG